VHQLRAPKSAVLREPLVHGLQRLRVEAIEAQAAASAFADEVRAPQQAQVLGNGRARNRKRERDLSGGKGVEAKEVKDGAAGGVGERLEDSCGIICN
jgi:hypothetical protein